MLESQRDSLRTAAMPKASEFYSLPLDIWAELQDVRGLWQLAVLAAAFGAAALVGRLLQPRFTTTDETLRFSLGGLQRLQFPLTMLIVVLVGRAVLRQWHSVALLNLAVPLLTALGIIRVVVYALRRVFAPGGWLRKAERFIAWTVWAGVALYISGLAPGIINFLDAVALTVGKDRLSLLLVLQAALSASLALLVALWLGRAIESRLMRAATLDANLRVMFAKVAQAVLVLVAALIALPAIGIDLTALSVFGGMLGVGIGFGLQKIASNYVSGFIILMDRSISIGDLVTVEQHTGQLTKMTARYVVVRSLTGVEAIIPNETIITSTVINHSYSDRRVRVPVPVQVSYRSDLDVAIRIMEEAARRHPRVLREPAPKGLILNFADSGVDLELGVWIEDPQEGQLGLRSELYTEIWRGFKRQGIEIPYPQREVRILGDAPAPAASC